MIERLFRWFLFTLVVAVLPLAIFAFSIWLDGEPPSMNEILGGGELLAICCALAAAAIGDVVATRQKYPKIKLGSTVLCVFVVAVTITVYVVVNLKKHHGQHYDEALVAFTSIYCFIATSIVSGVCVGISHEK